jgi:hypothetical protein
MKLDTAIQRQSYVPFIAFFLMMVAAFWYTYFTRIGQMESYRMHLHGAVMVMWCAMIIIQPYLIRTKKLTLHRLMGRASYLLIPAMVFTTIDLLKFRLTMLSGSTSHYAVALILNGVAAYVILYALAIIYRKKAALHSRFMISTVFPMFTPVTDRIIHIYFPSTIHFFPKVEQEPLVVIAGFALADLILAGLLIWDWRSHKRFDVFAFALLIVLAYQFSVLFFYRFDFWQRFSHWFISL